MPYIDFASRSHYWSILFATTVGVNVNSEKCRHIICAFLVSQMCNTNCVVTSSSKSNFILLKRTFVNRSGHQEMYLPVVNVLTALVLFLWEHVKPMVL